MTYTIHFTFAGREKSIRKQSRFSDKHRNQQILLSDCLITNGFLCHTRLIDTVTVLSVSTRIQLSGYSIWPNLWQWLLQANNPLHKLCCIYTAYNAPNPQSLVLIHSHCLPPLMLSASSLIFFPEFIAPQCLGFHMFCFVVVFFFNP